MTDGVVIGIMESEQLIGVVMQKGEPMDDLISRKAVFELLDDIDSIYLEDYDDTFKSYTDLVNALFDEDRLPSAQPDMSEYNDEKK